MLGLHLRVTKDYAACQTIALFIARLKGVTDYVVMWEISDKGVGHSHAHIIYNGTIDAFRKQLKKEYPGDVLVGNKHYTLERVKTTNELNAQYVCKGSGRGMYELILHRGIDVLDANTKYWDRHDVQKVEQQTIQLDETLVVPKKQPHTPFMPRVFDKLVKMDRVWKDTPQDLSIVFYYYYKMSAAAIKPCDDFIIKRNVRGILNSLIYRTSSTSDYKLHIKEKFETLYGFKFDPLGENVEDDVEDEVEG